MTLLEQAYQKMQTMPEENIRIILELMQVMVPSRPEDRADPEARRSACRKLKEIRRESAELFPKDFDMDAARDEALREKYGDFD